MKGKSLGAKRFEQSLIYTLAQNGTGKSGRGEYLGVYVEGKGAQLSNQKQLNSWSKKKLISCSTMLPLIDIAKEKGAVQRVASYWNTFHCFNSIKSLNDRIFGEYCKNRFCPLCCGIRKAEIINNYYPTIQNWPEPFFLTLTVKSTSAEGLEKRMSEMFHLLKQIIAKLKKRNQRGRGIKVKGIRSFECNFNIEARTYNPHFHILTHDYYTADQIRNEWITLGRKKWGRKFIEEVAQKSQRVENLDSSLIEIVKYSSKIFTDPETTRRKKGDVKICLAAYDNIISAMKKIRIFERFGFNLPKKEGKASNLKFIVDFKEWYFSLANTDWLEVEGTNVLTGYVPPPELSYILKNKIDTELK